MAEIKYNVSHKKNMKQRTALFGITILLTTILTGCSDKPVYYNQQEVISYVIHTFGTGYEQTNQTEFTDEHGLNAFQYDFSKDNFPFSVFASTYRGSIDGSQTNLYHKKIYDNYYESMIINKRDEMNAYIASAKLPIVLTGLDKVYSDKQYVEIIINSGAQTGEAGKIIEDIDAILEFECQYQSIYESQGYRKPAIQAVVYFQTVEGDLLYMQTFDFSCSSADRRKKAEIASKLDNILSESDIMK